MTVNLKQCTVIKDKRIRNRTSVLIYIYSCYIFWTLNIIYLPISSGAVLSCLDSIFRIALRTLSYLMKVDEFSTTVVSRLSSHGSATGFRGKNWKILKFHNFCHTILQREDFTVKEQKSSRMCAEKNLRYKILLNNSTLYHFWRIGNVRKHLAHYVNLRLISDIHRGLRNVSTIKPIYKQNHWKTRSILMRFRIQKFQNTR